MRLGETYTKKTIRTLMLLAFMATSYVVAAQPKYSFIFTIFPEYDEAEPFSEGLAVVKVFTNGQWKTGCVDMKGDWVVPAKYDNIRSFSEGFAAVEKNRKWGFVNKRGMETVPVQFDGVESYGNGVAVLVSFRSDALRAFIDTNPKLDNIPYRYSEARPFREGIAVVKRMDQATWTLIKKQGKSVGGLVYDYIDDFHDGKAVVRKGGLYGAIDTGGKVVNINTSV